jgi:Zn-dependent protease with chaperone function
MTSATIHTSPSARFRATGTRDASPARRVRLWPALCLGVAAMLASVPAASEDILSVLARSHASRLQTLEVRVNHDRREAVLRADFVRLQSRLPGLPQDMRLMVVDGAAIAETLAGHVVVVHADLADASEGERLFMLAHEIGHVALSHWSELGAVYHKHIPGEVNQQATDAVATALGREASQLVHGHEFAADAYAWRAIRGMGFELDSAAAVFHMMPNMGDTPTHPASRKRLAALRMIGTEDIRSAALPAR